MPHQLSLVDDLSLSDLRVYLGRAGRVEDGSVRLVASGPVLAVYVAVLYPVGLLDGSPTVLGLRTFALAEPAELDVVVPVRALLERAGEGTAESTGPGRTSGAPVSITVPVPGPGESTSVPWAAISPPRGGWTTLHPTDDSLLERVARAGIDEVAAAVSTGPGEQIVRRVRSEVWGRPVSGPDSVPAGGAFAAFSLGFLGDGHVTVFTAGAWTRLSSSRGHVLVRRRPGSALG